LVGLLVGDWSVEDEGGCVWRLDGLAGVVVWWGDDVVSGGG